MSLKCCEPETLTVRASQLRLFDQRPYTYHKAQGRVAREQAI